jgi:predicted Zn-dependent peptidase
VSIVPRIRDEAVRITTLPSGLRVVTEAMPHLATAALGVWVAAGSRHEMASEHGLAHMLEHMAFKGTTTRSARAIAEEIEAVGGELNAETNSEATAYFVRVLGEDVPRALDIIADILTRPAFDPAELEREKHVIIQEIGAYDDAPDELVFDLFMETAFADTALGRPILGTKATVKAQSPGSMRAFLARHYRTPAMVVAAAGAIDHERIVAQVETLFADLPRNAPPTADIAPYRGGDMRQKRNLEQVHVVLGFQGVAYDHPLHEAMHVFSGILGGGMSSRLFQELREKRGLCYDVHSFFTAFTDTGVFGVYGGTGEGDLAEFVGVLIDEMRETAIHPTETEIARARAQIKVSMLTALESPARRAEQMARHVLAYGRVLSRAEMSARIDAVGVTDVKAAAALLMQSKPTLAVIGPHRHMPSYDRVVARIGSPLAL